jgi:hypothetical protein
MNKDEAMKVLESVCAKFVGNLEDHKLIQSALSVIKSEQPPTEELKPDAQS